jgi:hypothetical protein
VTRSVAADRAQSNVVGVALLVGIAVLGMGALTAGIGAVVESNADTADAISVADGFDRALRPLETTGVREGHVAVTGGRLTTESRTLRVLNESGVVATADVDALVYRSGDRRVAYEAGAVVRGRPGNAWFHRDPSITASRGDGGVLIVSAPVLNASDRTVTGAAGQQVRLSTNVSHGRRTLGDGNYRVAVETSTPSAWQRQFEDSAGVDAIDRRLFPGDDHDSVVASYSGNRTAYLVVHDLRLEVNG